MRTDAFVAEQAAGRALYRGAFSVGDPSGGGRLFNPLDLAVKAIANTGVLRWAGRTFALHEVRARVLMSSQTGTLSLRRRFCPAVCAGYKARHSRCTADEGLKCLPPGSMCMHDLKTVVTRAAKLCKCRKVPIQASK